MYPSQHRLKCSPPSLLIHLSNERIATLVGWENNPYDNQHRGVRMCSAVLDTPVYNGHTTAVDALWGG